MRIIAGKYRGRKLSEFDGNAVRPTSDRAREGIFSALAFEIQGKKMLDGFSGSGAVGIEALSRGASEVVFTDSAKASCELTKKNLALVGERARVINCDCVRFLSQTDETFDIVFLDPPYKSDDGIKAVKTIASRKLLSDGGLVVIESGHAVNEPIDRLFIEKRKKYGIAEFTFYRAVKEDMCVFAGSFDPVTKGHIRTVELAREKYKKVIVALGVNENKKYTFDKFTRLKMLEAAFGKIDGVTVTDFDGLLVDFLKQNRVTANVRGIRNEDDLRYEEGMLDYNRKLFPEIKNVYITAEENYKGVSSTAARDALLSGKDLLPYLTEEVASIAKEYLKRG